LTQKHNEEKKMKLRTSSKVLAVSLIFLAAPSLVFANSVTVDCVGVAPGTFKTISLALASLTPAGPNDINVTCNLSDNVLIVGFSNLNIFSVLPPGPFTVTAANPNRRVVNVTNSSNVFVDGINFSGGRGVFINNSNGVQIADGTIQNSSRQGIIALSSVVDIFNLTIQNSTFAGVSAQGGTFNVDGGVTITGSGRSGIVMANGHLTISGGDGTPGTENVISNNTGAGVAVVDTAEADIAADNRITGNQGAFALEVIHTSTVIMSDGTISNNAGIGVHCGETSHCEWGGTTTIDGNAKGGIEITDHSDGYIDGGVDISNNTGAGVLVDLGSVFNSLGGNTINNNTDDGVIVNDLSVLKFAANDTIAGNGKLALECDNGSLVVGDVSTYKPKKCGPAFQAKPIK
jgi:hypothetical protein